jgi:hypothetical protein
MCFNPCKMMRAPGPAWRQCQHGGEVCGLQEARRRAPRRPMECVTSSAGEPRNTWRWRRRGGELRGRAKARHARAPAPLLPPRCRPRGGADGCLRRCLSSVGGPRRAGCCRLPLVGGPHRGGRPSPRCRRGIAMSASGDGIQLVVHVTIHAGISC